MPARMSPSLLALALMAGGAIEAHAADVLLPRNDKATVPHAGKGIGKQDGMAVPVVAMAVRPVPEEVPPPPPAAPPTPTLTGGGELGFAAASGNSNNESFNGRLDLTYNDGGACQEGAHGRDAGGKVKAQDGEGRERGPGQPP